MKKVLLISLILLFLLGVYWLYSLATQNTGAPPYQVADDPPNVTRDTYSWLKNWQRPAGPAKVALQAGHFKSQEVPDELHRLRGNTGATAGGKIEWEVNLEIAERTAEILKEKGITVEILPATVPPMYWADVFVAIHADGSTDQSKSGFKAAAPRRDISGKANELLASVETSYEDATNLPKDPNVTRNMRGYYAFGWWRYEHAIHPMTTAIILETGFLTNASDRSLLVNQTDTVAEGIAQGIIAYLAAEKLL